MKAVPLASAALAFVVHRFSDTVGKDAGRVFHAQHHVQQSQGLPSGNGPLYPAALGRVGTRLMSPLRTRVSPFSLVFRFVPLDCDGRIGEVLERAFEDAGFGLTSTGLYIGIDPLGNRRVGPQGSAQRSGPGDVADHRLDSGAGIFAGCLAQLYGWAGLSRTRSVTRGALQSL
jgi:hypothetical protein